MNAGLTTYLVLGSAIAFEVVGTSLLKASEQFSRFWPTLGVVICYGLAFYLLSVTLRTLPVGVAYALWSGLGIVLIALVGWLVYRQPLDAAAQVGLALIIAGIVVLNTLSKSAPH